MATTALLPTAQVLGITSSATLAGLISAMSLVSIPSLAELPAPLAARVWKRTYEIGVRTAPPLALGCAAMFGVLALQSRRETSAFHSSGLEPVTPTALYATAMVLVPSIVPYTIVLMRGINGKLMEKAEAGQGQGKGEGEETWELLRQWKVLNWGRAVIVLTGYVMGVMGSVLR